MKPTTSKEIFNMFLRKFYAGDFDYYRKKLWLPLDEIEKEMKYCEKKYKARYEKLKKRLGLK